ncbi:MAG: ABC transporter permease [Spirochaetota bacterium]
MNGFKYYATYVIKTGFRDKSLMMMNYLFPLGFLLMAGLFMTQLNPFFTEIMVPGMATFAMMSAALLNISGTVIQERENGIYRSFRVNGIPASSITGVPILANLLHALIVTGLTAALSILLFDGRIPLNWSWFIIVTVATALSVSTLGLLIGVVAPSQRAGILLAQAVYIPSVLLGGIMIPLEMMPENLTVPIHLLPASYSMQSYNALAMEGAQLTAATGFPLVILLVGAALQLLLSRGLFTWDNRGTTSKAGFLALTALLPYIFGSIVYAL